MRRFFAISLTGLAFSSSAFAFSYRCSENYRLKVRPNSKFVLIEREEKSCPEIARATVPSVRAMDMTRLQQVDRYDTRNRQGVVDSKSNSSYPQASCRQMFQLDLGETALVWVSDGVFRGAPDATLEVEYADPKKPLERLRVKCQIESP